MASLLWPPIGKGAELDEGDHVYFGPLIYFGFPKVEERALEKRYY